MRRLITLALLLIIASSAVEAQKNKSTSSKNEKLIINGDLEAIPGSDGKLARTKNVNFDSLFASKSTYLMFTYSSWCMPCMKMTDNLLTYLDTTLIANEANYILVVAYDKKKEDLKNVLDDINKHKLINGRLQNAKNLHIIGADVDKESAKMEYFDFKQIQQSLPLMLHIDNNLYIINSSRGYIEGDLYNFVSKY